MMPMPTPFDGYVDRAARVSSTCLVSVDRNRYSVPCELAGQMVSTRLYPDRVRVVAADGVVADHERLADRAHVRYDWQHYIELVDRKPGALRNGAPFADMPAPLRQLKLGLLRHVGGDKVMAQVLACVPVAGLEAVLMAVNLVIESGVLSAEHAATEKQKDGNRIELALLLEADTPIQRHVKIKAGANSMGNHAVMAGTGQTEVGQFFLRHGASSTPR